MRIIQLLAAILPSFLAIPLLRTTGASIGSNVSLRFGSLLLSPNIRIGNNVVVGPFSAIVTEELTLDDNVKINPFSLIKVRVLELGKYVTIRSLAIVNANFGKSSRLTVGDHSSIFPFCWLEPAEGITIGKQVGVGGHNLIFTHGSWSNYLKGGPIQFGPVTIEDGVWLPWRIFIMPGVTIGRDSVISANSVVNRDLPANCMAGGTPAKVIKENFIQEPDSEQRIQRVREMTDNFFDKTGIVPADFPSIVVNERNAAKAGDLLMLTDDPDDEPTCRSLASKGISVYSYSLNTFFIVGRNEQIEHFKNHLSIFGIRPYVEHID